MPFQVLGDVRAVHSGEAIRLGRRQERCLLGILLIESGRAVPVARLADLLWDGQPPSGHRGTIQTYVARLRAAVAMTGTRIVASGGGYLADAPSGSVDLHEFSSRLACARGVADPAQRASALSDALDLWRGPLLGGVATDRLRERIGLAFEELRLAAITECAEAELSSGRPEGAIRQLVEVVAACPVRENHVGLLMTAYLAAGRQTEALATYREARQRLIDDLGLEPGAALQDLHVRILRGAALRSDAGSGPRVAVIHGRGGAGKSALTARVSHEVAEGFPDDQIYRPGGRDEP